MNNIVYYIVNLRNYRFLIGSTCRWKQRKAKHLHDLRKGIHKNSHLQNAWNKYGEESFCFFIKYKYNLGKSHTLETKEKLRQLRTGKNNPMYGRRGNNSPNYKGEYIILQNIDNGEIISGYGIVAMANKINGHRSHLRQVIDGKVKSIKGWKLLQ